MKVGEFVRRLSCSPVGDQSRGFPGCDVRERPSQYLFPDTKDFLKDSFQPLPRTIIHF